MRSAEGIIKSKGTVVDVHALKAYGDVGVELHSFLTSALYVE
jgi:hypothetical protein